MNIQLLSSVTASPAQSMWQRWETRRVGNKEKCIYWEHKSTNVTKVQSNGRKNTAGLAEGVGMYTICLLSIWSARWKYWHQNIHEALYTDCNQCFIPQDGRGEGQDRGHGRQRRFLLHQNPVQLWGAVDQGAQVHAHQPEVGTRLGHLTVLQQINPTGRLLCWVPQSHSPLR